MIVISFIKYWFWEGPISIINFFSSLNHAFLELFSLPLLFKTFFKPLKNEYRKGLVGFSIIAGMFIKTILIIVDLLLLFYFLIVQLLLIIAFLLLPFLAIYFLIKFLI